MGFFNDLFGGGGDNPADAARPYLDQIPGVAKEQYNPYINRGNAAQEQVSGQYNRFASNPMDVINEIISSYKPSEGYKFREQKALGAARNSAAQGGFSGTQYDQEQQAELANGLLGDDMQQWLSNVLGVQGAGLQGQQHVADTGFNASTQLADILTNALSQQGNLAFGGQQYENSQDQGLLGGLSQLIGLGSQVGGLMGGLPSFGGGGGGGAGRGVPGGSGRGSLGPSSASRTNLSAPVGKSPYGGFK
ncbi:MAG: hypothetical protein ABIP54_02200 [Candidatus Andersenbacteria bacterium]